MKYTIGELLAEAGRHEEGVSKMDSHTLVRELSQRLRVTAEGLRRIRNVAASEHIKSVADEALHGVGAVTQ